MSGLITLELLSLLIDITPSYQFRFNHIGQQVVVKQQETRLGSCETLLVA